MARPGSPPTGISAGIWDLPGMGTGTATVMYSIRRTKVLWKFIREAGLCIPLDLANSPAGDH